ncbi:MAG: response regulator transcription factor [Pirellulales bacterium]
MSATLHVIDDDESFLRSMARRLSGHGYAVATYRSVADFLIREEQGEPGCVLTDLQMPGHDGFFLQQAIGRSPNPLPVIFVTGKGDIPASVRAMREGAEDFLTKRVQTPELLAAIARAIARNEQERQQRAMTNEARRQVYSLSKRELQMLVGVVRGLQNRDMAELYELSERTVKYYRTMLTRRLDIYASVDLARLVQDAGMSIEQLEELAESREMERS